MRRRWSPDVEVRNLPAGGPVDPKEVLAGKWRSIWTSALAEGEEEHLAAGGVEYAVYITRGAGVVRSNATGERAVAEGTGIVLLKESGATLVAGHGGLELFVVAVDV
jgi:hypothetical protein